MARAAEIGVPTLHHAWYKQTSYSYQESIGRDSPFSSALAAGDLVTAHLSGCRERESPI